ncbi:MAG TPA: hypothetical protein VK574_20675 [Terracidiphilus sp.]|nr:hypothetical protein [Terracidiphilus sp.]
MRIPWLLAVSLLVALPVCGESDRVVRVDFSNPGLYPAQWTLVFHPDGSGHFHAEGGTKPKDEEETIVPARVDRDVNLSAGFASRIFSEMHDSRVLQGKCESHLKVAFQGLKKISYSGPDGEGGCEFNYSTNKQIQDLGESLVAVGSTLIEGARLELLLQHDPLGLDKAIQYVVEASDDGRLQQICAIRDILERLEDDPHVLERVRKRAHLLLEHSGS